MAVRYLLDTSAYSVFIKGDERLRKWINADHDLIVPTIVIGELRAGFVSGNREQSNEASLRQFLDAPNVSVVSVSDKTTKHYAKVYAELKQQGKPIGTNDIWIAALTIEHDCMLVTLDSDYNNIRTLKIAPIT